MSSRNSIRSLIPLLFPFLFLVVVALVLQRKERVVPQKPQGVHLSKVELVPATANDISQGGSHLLRVSLDHSEPKPKWWSEVGRHLTVTSFEGADWSQFTPDPGISKQNYLVTGNTLYCSVNGKRVTYPEGVASAKRNKGVLSVKSEFKDGRQLFTYVLGLTDIPEAVGTLTFGARYLVHGEPRVQLLHVVRKRGENLKVATPDRHPWSRITLLKAEALPHEFGDLSTQDKMCIHLSVRHSPLPDGSKVPIEWQERQIVDSRGEVYDVNRTGFSIQWHKTTEDTPARSHEVFSIGFPPRFEGRAPLVFKGKFSLQGRWPTSVSLRLPPRKMGADSTQSSGRKSTS